MNDESLSSPHRSRKGIVGVIVLALLVAAGVFGWRAWQARDAEERAQAADATQRQAAFEQRLESIRRDQRTVIQRVQDAAATNRILRDEVLGLSQRGALLEESVAKLSDPNRHGAQALRLDEVEMLLSLADQRLAIADDLEGAQRAYALAAGALEGVEDQHLLNLKQTLAQERAALEALGAGPRAHLEQQLIAFASALDSLPRRTPRESQPQQSRWQRWLAPLVEVRPSTQAAFVTPADRNAGEAALHIEISLARAALERDDRAGFHAALDRIEQWLRRLWPDSPALRDGRQRLDAMRRLPLRSDSPVLGSTLQQLRALRAAGIRLPPVPATLPAVEIPEATP